MIPAIKIFRLYQLQPSSIKLMVVSVLLGLLSLVLLQSAFVSVLLCWLLLLVAGAGMVAGLLRYLGQR